MRILIFSPIYSPITGGASVYFSALACYIEKKEDVERVVILTTFFKNVPIVEISGKKVVLRILKATKQLPLFNSIIVVLCVLLLRIDLIHAHSSLPYDFIKKIHTIAKRFNTPLIVDIRDKDTIQNAQFGDYVFCVSEEIAEQVTTTSAPIYLITTPLLIKKHNASFLGKIKEKHGLDNANNNFLCFVGDICKEKGIYELVKGLRILCKEEPKYTLVMVGRDLTKGHFEKTIEKEHNIKYLGEMPHDEATTIIQCSDLLILPSRSEGVPRVCLEAMALKTRVVLPPTDVFRKYCPKHVLEGFTPQEIVKKIRNVLSEEMPSYPITHHDPKNIFEKIYLLYRKACTYAQVIRN